MHVYTKGEIMRRGKLESLGIEYVVDTVGARYGIDEEAPCQECGSPLYCGDTAIVLDTGDLFCGHACMRRAEARWLKRRAEVPYGRLCVPCSEAVRDDAGIRPPFDNGRQRCGLCAGPLS